MMKKMKDQSLKNKMEKTGRRKFLSKKLIMDFYLKEDKVLPLTSKDKSMALKD